MTFITVFSPDNRWRLHMFADGPVIYVYLYTFTRFLRNFFYVTWSWLKEKLEILLRFNFN